MYKPAKLHDASHVAVSVNVNKLLLQKRLAVYKNYSKFGYDCLNKADGEKQSASMSKGYHQEVHSTV